MKLQTASLAPASIGLIQWHRVRIARGGTHLVVPGAPADVEISWDLIRRLSDPQFAKEVAALAAEQARYIGSRLRRLREGRGLTQAQVSERAGLQPANLSRIENGHFDVATSTLWKVLAAMGYTPADLAESHVKLPRAAASRILNV